MEPALAVPQETEVTAKPKRRRFSAQEKLRVLRGAEACTKPGEIGALLRREGLYSMAEDGTGDVVLKLKRPLADGRATLQMTPLTLLRRLAGLVPVPRCHQVHYHGGFAPHANLRSRIVPRSSKLRRRCHDPVASAEENPERAEPAGSGVSR